MKRKPAIVALLIVCMAATLSLAACTGNAGGGKFFERFVRAEYACLLPRADLFFKQQNGSGGMGGAQVPIGRAVDGIQKEK